MFASEKKQLCRSWIIIVEEAKIQYVPTYNIHP